MVDKRFAFAGDHRILHVRSEANSPSLWIWHMASPHNGVEIVD